MLRRVARIARKLALLLGITLLAWMPFSFLARLDVTLPKPMGGVGAFVERGGLSLSVIEVAEYGDIDFNVLVSRARSQPYGHGWGLKPRFQRGTPPAYLTWLNLPLWLLAAVCLAWPVTSFVVARRRRRTRGFEVVADEASAEK